ncbi:hypothetical protein ACJ73_10206 [Blastomyces percursus]|uniref:Uncharacterized protein n=1 Tax=Blastomyces percursus TaxID=1658174 RepID=A0A1J9PP13_9EURO|nr:hypothetical protein ACJ73_10206 [Blastomyces percursus]
MDSSRGCFGPLHTFEKGESYPVTYAPKKQGHNAFQQSPPGEDLDSPTPKRLRLQSPDAIDEDQAESSEPEPETDTEVELAETILDQIPDDIPEPRSPPDDDVHDDHNAHVGHDINDDGQDDDDGDTGAG